MHRSLNANKGFTLIELIVTITVLTILLSVGVPSFSRLVSNSRAASLTNDLLFSLKLARSEAIKRGARVALCPRAEGEGDPECSESAADWQNGWLVISQTDCVDEADCQMLLDTRIDTPTHTVTYSQTRVWFDPAGRMVTGIGGTYKICDPRFEGSLRTVVVSPSGRTRLEKGADCI